MGLSETIYGVIATWCHTVLDIPAVPPVVDPPTPGVPAVVFPVIQAFQNAPAPAANYIAVSGEPDLEKVGQARRTFPEQPDAPAEEITAAPLVQDYRARVTLWEVGGHGDNLRRVLDTIELQPIQDYLSYNNISVLSVGAATATPQLEDREWVKEHRVEIVLAVAVQVAYAPGWIETVETVNQIPTA